jgi:uncharacterized membrane protein YfcA
MTSFLTVLIGILAGVSSGFFGIGGAVILVPTLIYLFKFSQHFAQGTALAALLLPVGIFAVIKYYQAGNVDIKAAVFLALGFLIGGFIGAHIAHLVPNLVLKKLFAILLFVVAIYMWLGK